MNRKTFRNVVFTVHRYIGLLVGLIFVVVGLTGSLLVFQPEVDNWLVQQRFGTVTHQPQQLSPQQVVNLVKGAYADRPEWKVHQLQMRSHQDFYMVRLLHPDDMQWEVFINPHTGKIIGDRQRETAFFDRLLSLHYQLLAGDTGTTIVGIVAFLVCVLSVTGLTLWSGWRKLITGFTIKWNAHPKRVNFDIHKVAGIISVAFLSLTAFTGFCWNFYDQAEPAIYALTFTKPPPESQSNLVKGEKPMGLDDILQRSNAALPGAKTTFISFPAKPDGVFEVYKKFPQNIEDFENSVQIDQYNGKILHVKNGLAAGLGDKVLNAFTPLHYGTFGGLLTRILYVFIGLSPMILFGTGLMMGWYRRRTLDRLI